MIQRRSLSNQWHRCVVNALVHIDFACEITESTLSCDIIDRHSLLQGS